MSEERTLETATAEAVERPGTRVNSERGRLLLVKRAQPSIDRSRTLQRNVSRNQVDDVNGIQNTLGVDEGAGALRF